MYAMLERTDILNLVLAGATSFYEGSRRLAIRSQVSIRWLVTSLINGSLYTSRKAIM